MEADSLSVIKDIAVILLLVAATALCTIVAVAVAKLSPIALRSAENLEKVTSDLAAAGVELPALMTAGRWKSSKMPAHYTERQVAGREAVARYYQGGGLTGVGMG